MTRPSAAFRERLAAFSRADLAAFLGDLREARGWTVDPDGVVRSIDVQYEATVDGTPLGVHRTVSYEALGETTVDPPDWYE